MKVKARISKTNKFREVTLRREPEWDDDALCTRTPAYTHVNRKTVSGFAYESNFDKWIFRPSGKNESLLYKKTK